MTKQNYIHQETAKHPIKRWTNGVPVEEVANKQLINIASLPFIHKHVAVMPDVHWGMGATVGSVIATKGAIVPAAVGVDIGCFDSETEYLGVNGWNKISEYKSGNMIMQFNKRTGKGEFVKPQRYIDESFTGEFIHLKTKYGVDQMLTPDHRCLVYKNDRSYKFNKSEVVDAECIYNKHHDTKLGYRHKFLTSFIAPERCEKLKMSNEEIRLMIMVCADGCFSQKNNRCNLAFKKKRKIKRAKNLLEKAGIEFNVFEYKYNITRISFLSPFKFKILNLWGANRNQLEIICSEVLKWDGTESDNIYFTRSKQSADFVQYCFSATGKRATITTDFRESGIDYRVVVSENIKIGISGTPKTLMKKVKDHNGRKYCFTVPSSFLVMRRNGNIFITGNCGMMAVETTLKASDLPDNLHAVRCGIETAIPHGRTDNGGRNDRGRWANLPDRNTRVWHRLEIQYAEILAKHPKAKSFNNSNHLGTLGTGNHFIEVCLDENDSVWIMLHSGSRGAGNKIGMYFIEKAKKEMEKYFIGEYLPDKDLSYFVENTEIFDDYVQAVGWAQEFALENRKLMLDDVVKVLRSNLPKFRLSSFAVNCHHNYISKENHFGSNVWVTRKGAVRARKGDLGIIPGSMGTGSFIVAGLGNKDSFCSCSHGAGRVMSRTQAKKVISLEQHAQAMEGIEARLDKDVIDESPAAYKDINAVMDAQKDLVEIVHRLRQVINVKG